MLSVYLVDPIPAFFLGTFVQDKILLGSSWSTIIGSKLEHNDYTGFEGEPVSSRLPIRCGRCLIVDPMTGS